MIRKFVYLILFFHASFLHASPYDYLIDTSVSMLDYGILLINKDLNQLNKENENGFQINCYAKFILHK